MNNVSLTITSSVFGLLGPNRAGKTTLVKLLLSLAQPTVAPSRPLGEPIRRRHTLGVSVICTESPRYLSATDVLHFYGGLSGVAPR